MTSLFPRAENQKEKSAFADKGGKMIVYIVFAYFQSGITKYRIASTHKKAEEFKKEFEKTYGLNTCVDIQVKKIDE